MFSAQYKYACMQSFYSLVQFQQPSLLVKPVGHSSVEFSPHWSCAILPFSSPFPVSFLSFSQRFFFIVVLIVCFVCILSLFGSPFATSPSSCSSVTYAISFQYDIAKNKLHSGLKLNCKSCCLEQVWANRKKCTNVMFVSQGTTT